MVTAQPLNHLCPAGSISSGGDHGIQCWCDQIRSKQMYSFPHVACECLLNFLVVAITLSYILNSSTWFIHIFPVQLDILAWILETDLGNRGLGVECVLLEATRTHMVKWLRSNNDWLIWHRLYVASTGGPVIEFRLCMPWLLDQFLAVEIPVYTAEETK